MVVGKYTQTRQRWLRAKIVKFGNSRRYKKGALTLHEGKNRARTIVTTI